MKGGKAWYKGGRDGDCAVWYHAGKGQWYVGDASWVGGTNTCAIYAQSTAVTPDAVQRARGTLHCRGNQTVRSAA